MDDNKLIELEDYCHQLLKINNKSETLDKIDLTIFIYDIKNTELNKYLTNDIINKLQKICTTNNKNIYGSWLTKILFSSIDKLYEGHHIKFTDNDNLYHLLNHKIEDRIYFDHNKSTIYFTIKWLNNFKINNETKLNNEINHHISYQYFIIHNFIKKTELNNLYHTYNQYDIDMMDYEYILRYFFHNMDLIDDGHIKYIIYLFVINPNILLDSFNNKNIMELLLEEYESTNYIDKLNQLIAYINSMNPSIFTSNLINNCKNEKLIYLLMHYIK